MFEGAGLVAQTMGPPTLSFYDELLRVTTNYPTTSVRRNSSWRR